ncbi:hypothetical protein [Nocardia brasiliensis]|uniref:hypothetical protein n=1 Tax=Nocardia brasiliensis TaxID=37326 RepID=UPI00245618DA|nr:hypothetical protein [Nocardia brasiliensis]
MAVYEVPPTEGKRKENRFAFRVNGKIRSIPKLAFISGNGAKFAADNDGALSYPMLYRELIAIECPAVREEVYAMADDQIINLSEAWVTASGITAGESEGSEDS